MMQQDVVLSDFLEDVTRLPGQVQLSRDERPEFEIGSLGLLVDAGDAGQISRPVCPEYLPLFESKVSAQAFNDFRRRGGFYLQSHCVALAAIVKFSTH